jgi:hypothetical protein
MLVYIVGSVDVAVVIPDIAGDKHGDLASLDSTHAREQERPCLQ